MRIHSLGALAKIISVPAALLVLSACGANSHTPTPSQQSQGCGCGFLYATTSTNQILSLKLDSTGVPGAPAQTPGPANSLGITSDGSFLYVSDPDHNALDSFTLNPNDGTFTPVAGSPFALNTSSGAPAGISVTGYSATKTYLYAGDTNGNIAAFMVGPAIDNGSTWVLQGNLTPLGGSPYAAGAQPLQLASWGSPQSLTDFVYAADFADPNGGVYAFSVGLDGTLSPVAGSPFVTAPGAGPSGIVSAGIWLYVALHNTNQIAAFTAAGNGALTPLPGSPYAAGNGPSSLIAYGNFLYSLNDVDHSISAYSMDFNTGMLTAVSGSPFSAGSASGGLATYLPGPNYSGPGFLYAPDPAANGFRAFSVDPTAGSLKPLAGSPFPAGTNPMAITVVRFPGLPLGIDPP
jgi:6-phosphogluconolactonase